MIKLFSERQRWSEWIKKHDPTIYKEVNIIRTEKMCIIKKFICKFINWLKLTGWKTYTMQTVDWSEYINMK